MAEPLPAEGPTQWTQADLERAERAGDYRRIDQARKDGNLDHLMTNADEVPNYTNRPMHLKGGDQ